MKSLSFLLLVFALPLTAAEKERRPLPSLDGRLFSADLWQLSLEDLKESAESSDEPPTFSSPEEAAKHAAKTRGNEGFNWLSVQKEGLRAAPRSFELLGQRVGEVVIRGAGGKASDITISLYNRGDDDEIGLGDFETRMTGWKNLLDAKLNLRAQPRDQRGAVATTGWMWKNGGTAILLEGSVNRSEKRAEFIRLRLASLAAARTNATGVGRRGTFAANVRRDDEGFVWIDGIPMVDQGEKGYCVVATVERVARYFGADIDQHEMAQLADTGENGTRGDAMEKAFQRITGRIHLRTIKHIEFDGRQLSRDVRGYNRAARAAIQAGVRGVKEYPLDPKEWYIDPRHLWLTVHKETFRDMKAGQGGYDHFNRKIREYIDQGIPLCWTLYLGMFPEKNLPQSYGGHMRLIIGYNEATGHIYYSDSWGHGHERKNMRADEAYCMTTALYSMMPSR